MLPSEHLLDLQSSPRRLLPFQLQNLWAVFFITFFTLVAGLARYPEFWAQIRHPFARFEPRDKLHSFVHCCNLFPGHGPSSTPLKVLPMSPVIFVTYASGLHHRRTLSITNMYKTMLEIAECLWLIADVSGS